MRRACQTRAEEGKPPSTQERARFGCCGGETLSPDVGGWEGPSTTFSFSCASHSSSSVVGDQYRRAGAQRRDGGRRLLPTLSVRGDSPSRGPASCEGSDSPPPWEGEAPSPDPRGHGTLGPLSRGHCRAGCSPVPPLAPTICGALRVFPGSAVHSQRTPQLPRLSMPTAGGFHVFQHGTAPAAPARTRSRGPSLSSRFSATEKSPPLSLPRKPCPVFKDRHGVVPCLGPQRNAEVLHQRLRSDAVRGRALLRPPASLPRCSTALRKTLKTNSTNPPPRSIRGPPLHA